MKGFVNCHRNKNKIYIYIYILYVKNLPTYLHCFNTMYLIPYEPNTKIKHCILTTQLGTKVYRTTDNDQGLHMNPVKSRNTIILKKSVL